MLDITSPPQQHAAYNNTSSSSTGTSMGTATQTPPVRKNASSGATDPKENLWTEILSEVQQQGSTKLPSNKSVLVLGDNAAGKTTLIAKLQGVEDPKKGSGLEYAYIDVRDEYRDDLTRLGVWVLDGDPGHANLLKFALNETNYAHTLVILTVSMTAPWSWLDQLQSWCKVLADHADQLKIDADVRQEQRQRLVTAWQNYCESGDELDPVSPMKRTMRISSVDEEDLLPLPDNALVENLGLDLVVVVTKTDYMSTLEKEYDYRDEHFDFMQQWIRSWCLQHGASLFYTSVKEDKNCDLLYKYLTHRIYDLPFRTPALVVEKDAVLIPSGWDNMKKISILHENMQSCKPEDNYTDVITAPPSRKTVSNREQEVHTEDEQAFLARQQQAIQQGQPHAVNRTDSPSRPSQAATSKTPRASLDPNRQINTPGGEGVLANFFNSLLNKKTGTPGSPAGATSLGPNVGGTGVGGSPLMSTPHRGTSGMSSLNGGGGSGTPPDSLLRNDAAAELERLTRNVSVKREMDFSEQSTDC